MHYKIFSFLLCLKTKFLPWNNYLDEVYTHPFLEKEKNTFQKHQITLINTVEI